MALAYATSAACEWPTAYYAALMTALLVHGLERDLGCLQWALYAGCQLAIVDWDGPSLSVGCRLLPIVDNTLLSNISIVDHVLNIVSNFFVQALQMSN